MHLGIITSTYLIFFQFFICLTEFENVVEQTGNSSRLKLGQKNVCPYEELQVLTVQRPCMRALTRYVRKRKARNCPSNVNSASCAVRVPKTFYFHSTTNFTRKRRELVPECCPGWIHLDGETGCLKANCTPQLCENGGTCLTNQEFEDNRLCQCPSGFHGSTCQFDVNECLAANGGCEHECVNIVGSFYCRCHSGFELAENSFNCIDVDECKLVNGGCQYKCLNTRGGYLCQCPYPMQLAPNGRDCVKENKCNNQNGGCEQICEERSDGKFWRCRCRKGYKLGEDRKSCLVENPCAVEENRCQHFCLNAGNGKAKCQCYPGFKLAEDQYSCIDIDECLDDESPRLCSFGCENTLGGYQCICPEGFQLNEDGFNCEPYSLATPFSSTNHQFIVHSLSSPEIIQQKSLQPERLKIRGIVQHYEVKENHEILPFLNISEKAEAEMKISTTCPNGYFGINCSEKCDCENDANCDADTGECLCPSGFIGAHCEFSCLEDHYGIGCFNFCFCQNGGKCDHKSGECSCLPGFRGSKCNKICPAGRFGDKCREKCQCADGSKCDPVNGQCICGPGRMGQNCLSECPEGQFGENCHRQCECYNGAKCNSFNGKCQCLPGYFGPNCKLEFRDPERMAKRGDLPDYYEIIRRRKRAKN